jgi:hypothetical protein
MRVSLCAYIDTQFAAPAPDEAALNLVVKVISLFVMCPPPLHPILIRRSGSATPLAMT